MRVCMTLTWISRERSNCWTPVFLVISGLVLETGGGLAHGSCLSREYGLPCVQLANATELIPDGANISIDGAMGLVTID